MGAFEANTPTIRPPVGLSDRPAAPESLRNHRESPLAGRGEKRPAPFFHPVPRGEKRRNSGEKRRDSGFPHGDKRRLN
ncbi:hypothetical protein GCM10007856_38080 [Azospirillum oryzae]|nr:hypothetical protein GCM10007856_38080 [Azospirillum oryzae]